MLGLVQVKTGRLVEHDGKLGERARGKSAILSRILTWNG